MTAKELKHYDAVKYSDLIIISKRWAITEKAFLTNETCNLTDRQLLAAKLLGAEYEWKDRLYRKIIPPSP